MGQCLGIDTSNYTTSIALFDGEAGHNLGHLLAVSAGELGLRQSDALFQHVKQFPLLIEQLREEGRLSGVKAVGASTQPRAVEGSYMPCFLAGAGFGRSLAAALGVPFVPCAHQQGHIAAAAWSAGCADLLDKPHLAWHLSGGTTELLHVTPDGTTVSAKCIGGTSDISAGQLIDRTGKLLGLDFPAGQALDALAATSVNAKHFTVKLQKLFFSLSGIENQMQQQVQAGASREDVARFVLETVASVVGRVTSDALQRFPALPVLCSGGVASNRLLRARLPAVIFAPAKYSTDNALGVAILAHRSLYHADK